MTKNTCNNCHFMRLVVEDDSMVKCHRNPNP